MLIMGTKNEYKTEWERDVSMLESEMGPSDKEEKGQGHNNL